MKSTFVNHLGLAVTDLARARRFYMGAFGFSFDRELKLKAGDIGILRLPTAADLHAVYLVLDGLTLELLAYDPPARPSAAQRAFNDAGLTHMSLSVADMPATVDRVQALGGTVFSQQGDAYVVRDPDGQFIELLSLDFHRRVETERAARAAGPGAPDPE